MGESKFTFKELPTLVAALKLFSIAGLYSSPQLTLTNYTPCLLQVTFLSALRHCKLQKGTSLNISLLDHDGIDFGNYYNDFGGFGLRTTYTLKFNPISGTVIRLLVIRYSQPFLRLLFILCLRASSNLLHSSSSFIKLVSFL